MLRRDIDADREKFLYSLVESILNDASLGHLTVDEKASLITFLSEKRFPLPPTGTNNTQTRLRALKKATSDANRLANSLKLIDAQDVLLCDLENTQNNDISNKILNLSKTAEQLETRTKHLVEDAGLSARSTQTLRSLYAFPLVTTLEHYGIATSTRNDFLSISAIEDCKGKNKYLPEVDSNATAAMRCVMLALYTSNTKNIDWSLTVSLINLAKPLRDQSVEKNAICAEIKELMMPYVNQLHYNMSLTVDSFENHVEYKPSATQEDWLNRSQHLPIFIPNNSNHKKIH